MITLTFQEHSGVPLYQQLYTYIKEEIESGRCKGGERLPSKRSLAAHLKVSVMTVETAYAQLLAEGYLVSKPGSGYYVEQFQSAAPVEASIAPEAASPQTETVPIRYDFSTDKIDTEDFPFSTWAKLSREVLSEGGAELLNACHCQGTEVLRREIAAYLHHFKGIEAKPEQIVVGAGTEYLYSLILQLLGRDNSYGVENPGYRKTYQVFQAHAARVFPIPLDEKGIDLAYAEGFGIHVLHCTPAHHFPLGITMPFARRRQLLDWANARSQRYLLEDDYDGEFRYSGRPVPTLKSMDQQDKVIYINTFTKSLAPSMRISYMLLPEKLCAEFAERLYFYACTVPVFEQITLARFLERGYFERHINRRKKLYKSRRDSLLQAIRNSRLGSCTELSGSDAGMHIRLQLLTGMPQQEMVAAAAAQGVRVRGLSSYYTFPSRTMPESSVVLGYSGMHPEQLAEAVRRLEHAWIPQ